MDRIVALDPGSEESAWVVYDGENPLQFAKEANHAVLELLPNFVCAPLLVVEYMKPRGMPTSKEEIDTMFWAGRFVQSWGRQWRPVFRHDVKMHICGDARAKDKNIRQALIDLWGGENQAIGGIKCPSCKGKGWCGRGRPTCIACDGEGWKHPPGPLHGIANDVWQALAVAVTFCDQRQTA